MKLSEELQWRGFVNQTTFKDLTELDQAPISFYFGVEPSSDSMTIGNFASAMMVRHLIDYGHKAFLLVGGATVMIGDPDGKAEERPIKTLEEIEKNKQGIASEYRRIFAGQNFEVVDNYDWFKPIGFIDFLRNIGKHVPMSQMLGREFVQSRLGEGGSGISYAEFSYALMQGYDFVHLYREHGVTLQVCGADQWGNSIAGVDLIRRLDGGEAHVYSAPLVINKTTGVKFGKSEGGAIWLNSKKTSVYKFYQFWLNLDDDGVIDYAKIYTLLSKEEIEALDENHRANPSARSAQKTLAREVTTLVHGKDRTESVERVTGVLFGEASFNDLTSEDIDALSEEIPTVSVGKTVIECLVEAHVASSNGEVRRLIESGAISINGDKVTDNIVLDTISLLKKGKNNFVLIR
jgi:tyrosyl-tRNA synthetase